jgi:hypothetical protein
VKSYDGAILASRRTLSFVQVVVDCQTRNVLPLCSARSTLMDDIFRKSRKGGRRPGLEWVCTGCILDAMDRNLSKIKAEAE